MRSETQMEHVHAGYGAILLGFFSNAGTLKKTWVMTDMRKNQKAS